MIKDQHNIYLAKCKDLGVPPAQSREKRFIAVLNKAITGASLDLHDHGLGMVENTFLSALPRFDDRCR